ncbi:unnamed protein product [Brassica oleracea]|uniref:Uncharacterized protein n=1 Tax=Brassica oleracea TaxID=3712 RepID=A0A3P6CR13_BRAOL|nr:unnamed protein product [Brassica oleracea]
MQPGLQVAKEDLVTMKMASPGQRSLEEIKEELASCRALLAIRDLKAQLKPELEKPTDGDTVLR